MGGMVRREKRRENGDLKTDPMATGVLPETVGTNLFFQSRYNAKSGTNGTLVPHLVNGRHPLGWVFIR